MSTKFDCLFLMINTGTEFVTSSKALEMLRQSGCFDDKESGSFSWPKDFETFISKGLLYTHFFCNVASCHSLGCLDDPLGLTAASNYDLAVSALGACLWYLQRCFIDKDLLSIKSFEVCLSLSSLHTLTVSRRPRSTLLSTCSANV